MLRRRLLAQRGESFRYIRGPLTCPQGSSFNNYYSGSATTGVHMTFRLGDAVSWKTLARNVSSSGTNGWDLHITSSDYYHILEFTEMYNGYAANFQWWGFEPLVAGKWYTIDFFINSSAGYLSLNGSSHMTATVSARQRSSFSNSRNVSFGCDLVDLRGEVGIWGTSYNASSTGNWAGWNIDNGTVGSALYLTSGNYTLTSQNKVKRGWE